MRPREELKSAVWPVVALAAIASTILVVLYWGVHIGSMLAYGDLRPFPSYPAVGDYFRPWHLQGLGNSEQRPPSDIVVSLGVLFFGQPIVLQQALFFAEIPLAILSMFLLARRLFRNVFIQGSIALFYGINPLTLQEFAGGAIGLLWAYVWLPPIVGSLVLMLESPSWRGTFRLAVFCAIGSLFYPHAGLFVFGLVVAGLALAWLGKNMGSGVVKKTATKGLFALAVFLVLLLPSMMDLVAGYFRASESLPGLGLRDVTYTYGSSEPWNAFRLLAVGWQGTPLRETGYLSPTFWGIAASVLPLFAIISPLTVRRETKSDYIFVAAYGVSITILLFSFLAYAGLLNPLFSSLPILLQYRSPVKMSYALAFCLSLLLGFSLSGLSDRHQKTELQQGRGRPFINRVPSGMTCMTVVVATVAVMATPFYNGMALSQTYGPGGYYVSAAVLLAHDWLDTQRDTLYDFRTLWLPLDYANFLQYQGIEEFTFDTPLGAELRGGTFTAVSQVADTLRAICREQPWVPDVLGLASVKFIVVLNNGKQYPGCTEQGGQLFANSTFLRMYLGQSPALSVAVSEPGFTIYENHGFIPPLSAYNRVLHAHAASTPRALLYIGANALNNSDFSEGLESWVAWWPNESTTLGQCIDFHRCAQVEATHNGSSLFKQRFRTVPGIAYQFNFWLKSRNASNALAEAFWYSSWNATEGQRVGTTVLAGPWSGDHDWQEFNVTEIAPSDSVAAELVVVASTEGNTRSPPTVWLARPAVNPILSNPGGEPGYGEMLYETTALPAFSQRQDLLVDAPLPSGLQPTISVSFNHVDTFGKATASGWISIIEPDRTVYGLRGLWKGGIGTLESLGPQGSASLMFNASASVDVRLGLNISYRSNPGNITGSLNGSNITFVGGLRLASNTEWMTTSTTTLRSGTNELILNVDGPGVSLLQLIVSRPTEFDAIFRDPPSGSQVAAFDWSFSPDSGYSITIVNGSVAVFRISQAYSDIWQGYASGTTLLHATDGTYSVFYAAGSAALDGAIRIFPVTSSSRRLSVLAQESVWLLALSILLVPGALLENGVAKLLPPDSEKAAWVRLNRDKLAKRICRFINVEEGERVLDIGCGPGYYTGRIADAVRTVEMVVGCDIRRSDLKSGWLAGHGTARVQANAQQLPFKSESFKVVVVKDLLHHVDSPESVIKEAGRVTTRTGTLIIVEANLTHPLQRALALYGGHRHMDISQLRRLLVRQGSILEETQVEANPLFYYVSPGGSIMLVLWDSSWALFQVATQIFPPLVTLAMYCEAKLESSANWHGRLAFNVVTLGRRETSQV